MEKYGYVLIACIAFLLSSQMLGSEQAFIINDCHESVITKVIDDRCYVKPGSIYVAEQGIFLCDGTELFPLFLLEADEQGVFFRITSDYEKCPSCRRTKVFGKCNTKGCSRYGTQVAASSEKE